MDEVWKTRMLTPEYGFSEQGEGLSAVDRGRAFNPRRASGVLTYFALILPQRVPD